MAEAVWEHGILFYAVGVMCIIGALSKLVVQMSLGRLVREAGKMGKSLHPLMKLVRAKFEHACMVSDKVQNVRAFVDKYIFEYRVGIIRLHSLRQLEKAAVFGCLFFGGAGCALAYFKEAPLELFGQYAAAGAAGAVLLTALRIVTDENYQLDAASNYMVDFLENTYAHRYAKINQSQKEEAWEGESAADVMRRAVETDMTETKAEEENLEEAMRFAKEAAFETEEEICQKAEKEEEERAAVKAEKLFMEEKNKKETETEPELVTLMKEEQKKQDKRKNAEERYTEEKKRDEQMIREILAEFLA